MFWNLRYSRWMNTELKVSSVTLTYYLFVIWRCVFSLSLLFLIFKKYMCTTEQDLYVQTLIMNKGTKILGEEQRHRGWDEKRYPYFSCLMPLPPSPKQLFPFWLHASSCPISDNPLSSVNVLHTCMGVKLQNGARENSVCTHGKKEKNDLPSCRSYQSL